MLVIGQELHQQHYHQPWQKRHKTIPLLSLACIKYTIISAERGHFQVTYNKIEAFTFVCKTKVRDIGIQAMVPESNLSQTCKDYKFVIHTKICHTKRATKSYNYVYLTSKFFSCFPMKSLWELPRTSQSHNAPIRRNHMWEFVSQ